MKKILSLIVVFLTLIFGGNAQYLLQEGFETGILSTGWITVDADGDGYNWEDMSTGVNGHNSSYCAFSHSWISATGALTPDNWLISPAVNLTSNAILTFWVCAQDASYAAEHYGVYISTTASTTPDDFTLLYEETIDANGGAKTQGLWKEKTIDLSNYTGQTVRIAFRHFNSTDMFYLNLDDVEIIAQPTVPTITANPTDINFGNTIIGNSKISSAVISTYNLTAAVTATANYPFSVSADGSTYGSSVSLSSTGDTLYMKYTPTTPGTDYGTVTLSSTGAADVTITVAGNSIDCSTITVPIIEDFESSIDCWTMVSMDPANDDRFGVYADADAYDGAYDFHFSSYSTAYDYNQWLITPELTLNVNETYIVKFFYKGYNANENFKVMYSTTNNNPTSFTMLADYTNVSTSWTDVVLELPAGTKYVAIDYYSNYQYYLYVDNFSIMPATSSMSLSETALDFGINEMGSTSDVQYVVMNTISVNEPFTVTATAPFEVSLDGTTFATTQTIPANATTVVYDTIFVRFAPTTAGTFNESLTVSSTSYNGTVALTGESLDCSPGITVPYTQNFNAGLAPPTCWSIGTDPEIFMSYQIDETDYCIGMQGMDMLITPEIHATDPILVTFDYINYGGTGATAPTYFHVGYSTTDNNPTSFTWQGEQPCSTDAFESFSTIVPAGTKYVAVGASQIGTFLYWGIYETADIFIIDNFTLTAQTDALLTVSPESMSFGSTFYGSSTPVQTASVVGALLTSDINVTAPANFEVSANGTTYAATATLPLYGGTLYVRYNPTAPGNHNGTITITGDAITTTITVSGNAINCTSTQSLPFLEGFENGLPACWTALDQDGDSYTWVDNIYSDWTYEAYEGEGCVMSASYINNVGALTPDNWLISPALAIPDSGATLSWYVTTQDPNYPNEFYDVMISSSTTPDSFTSLFNETLFTDEWQMRTVNINGNWAGQTVHIAFRHHNSSDMYWMKIDNVSVTANGNVPLTVITLPASNIALTTATLNATITNPDNVTITAKGFEWKATTGGTYTQIVGSGTDNTFTANLSGLTPYTNYTYRAFITYNGYTVYGGEMTFTTTEEEAPCLLTFEMHDSYGDGWNGNKILIHNHDTIQEVTLESDNYGLVSVPVYNGALEMEWVDGSYKNECSVTITGPCLYYSCSQYEAPSGTFLSSNVNCGGGSPAVPSFSYWTENTCSSVIVLFENTSTNADSVFWNIDGFTTNEWNPIHEFTESGTYPITIQAYNSSCELYGVTTQNITVTVPAPITTVLDTAVQSSDLPLTWYGHTFTGTETYTTVLQAANGCDSTVTLILTGCDIASVPYFESFEGFGSFPPCWTKYSTSSNSPYISTSYHSDGAASLCFSKSSTTQQYVASDAIDVSNYNAGDLAVSFSLLPDGLSYARMDVGIMTDPNDISSFSLLKSYYPSDFIENHVWHNVSIPIMQYYSNPIYIVFYAPNYSSTYMYVDEVRVDLTPTCSAPSNLKISNIAGTSAMISWTASQYGNGSYMVEYSDNNTTWNSMTTTETAVMLTNLTPTNLYYVRVYHSCSSENSDTLYDSFTTRCLAGGEISIGEGTGTSSYVPSYSTYNFSYSQQIYMASEFNGPTDITSISMNLVSLSQQRNYKIYLAHTTATDLGSGWASTSGAQLVFSSPQTLVTGWNTFDFTTPFSYNGTDNLLVIFIDSTGSWVSGNSWQVHNTTSYCARYLYQDSSVYPLEPSSSSSGTSLSVRNNVKFGGDCDETITCIAPNAYLSDITAESVTLNWVPGYTENSWEVEYCTDTANWVSAGTVSTSPYTIDNLDANTLYTVRMRSVCGNGDYSYWVTMQARTTCDDIAVLPYTENFDSYGTGTNVFPTCWGKINTSSSNYPQISTTCFEGTGSLYFYANNGTYNIAVAPPISSEIPVNTLQANFMYRATNATDMLIVGVMTDPAYESTFVPVYTIYPASQANNWMEQRVTFDQYTGEGRFIAFKNQYTSTYCYSYIDNLVINLIENCPRPMHVAAISTPSDTVYLSWDAGTGNQWDVIYGPVGFDPNDDEAENTVLIQGVTDNPYTISGLAGGMGYDFYVRTDCDNDDYSEWSSFPASAYPFSYAMGITGSDTVTGCNFTITDNGGLNDDYSNYCEYTLTIYPEIPDNLVSVQGTSNTEANYDYLYIYDGADATGTLLGTFNGQGLTVPELVSSTGPLTIHFHSDASVTYSGFQLTVSCISNTCPKPTDLIVSNINMNSADLAWTPGGDETSWNVEYKESSDATWTMVTSSTASYQLTGLTAGTNYNVRVQADCGDETSQYLTTSFSTPLCEVADQCTYTFVLTDGYGDGWNGASLTVRQNNEVVSVLEAESHGGGNVASVDTVTVNLCDGVSTSLEWTSGSYDDEAGFTLIGPDGTQIYTIDDMETYTTYTFTTNCNGTIFTDPTIATEIATNVTLTTATLNATITNPDNVTITAKGFEWKATTGGTYTQIVGSGTDNTFTANLSGLTPYTNYTYRAFITYNGYTVYGGEVGFTTVCDSTTIVPLNPITIGTGTTTDYTFPFNNFYKNSWNEMIYPASLINESGLITSIAFHVSAVPTSDYPFSTLTIYMGTSSDSVHHSTTSWLPMSDLTEVYNATNVSSPTDTGWLTIDLDTPFQYNGTENLVIVTSKTMPTYTSALKFYYTAGPSGCCMYRRGDSDVSYADHPGSNTGTTSSYRPNLQLTFVPICGEYCYSVKNLSATDVTTTDANITWQSSESAVSYILQYKTADQPWDENVTTVNTTDTTFYLNGLTAITTYNVRVASYCGSDTSSWKSVSFTTPCEESWDVLPYVEDFEGYASYSVPNCWTRLQTYTNGSTVYPYVNNASANAHNGTGYFYCYGGNNFFALPHFSESVNNLRLTFWMKPNGTTSSYGYVEVGVMSGLNDANTFQQVAAFYADSIGSNAWQKYMVDFSDVTTSDNDYIVIRRYVSSTYAWYFDDLSVDYIPSCEAPTELAFVGATTNSVTLKWNPGEESLFNVYYKAISDEDYTEVSGVTLDADSTYMLMNLESSTNYTVYVSSVCFDGSVIDGDPISIATTMIPVGLPYTTDFSENADRNWLLNNGTCINYWTMGAVSNTANALYITNDGTSPAYTVSSAISMVSASKLFTIGTAPRVNISFDVMVGGESMYDYIKLFFSPETETYPAKASVAPTSSEYGYNSYSQYAFDFSDYFSQSTYTSSSSYPYRFNLTGGNVVHIDAIMPNPHENPDENSTAQVVFTWKNDNSGGTQPGAIISNVTITVPSCPRPENLAATNLTPHSADLSWSGGDATSWTVEYGTHDFTLGTGTTINVAGNPETTLTGLTDNTEYDVYVKAVCDGEESPYKNITFTTPCNGITILSQTWDMDSNLVAGTSNYPLPGCWTRIGSGTSSQYPYAYNSSTYAHSGSRCLYFYNSYPNGYAILPGVDPGAFDIHNLQVSFFARASSVSAVSSLQVGVMTDPADPSSFTLVQTIPLATSYDSETFDVPFTDYPGNGNYVAFHNVTTGSATNSFYVDDITLMEIPDCSKAKNLTAMPTTHEADLTWTGPGSSYDLYYKAASDANYTTIQGVTLTDGYYQLTGLTAATEYSWYIVTNCDDATTFTSNIANFVTECEALTTVPQTWDFDDNLTAGTSSYPLPACWNRISTSTTTTQYPYSYNSSTYAHSGTRSLYFYNSYLNSLAILPGINTEVLSLTDLQLTFYARLSTANENVRLLVGVMDSPSDAASFTVVDTIVLTNEHPVDPFIVSFENYEGSGAYVAFKNVTITGATVANGIYIDDVTLEEIPVCSAPVGTQIFPAALTANVYWENMDQGTYNVYLKKATDMDYTVISGLSFADNVLVLDELDPSTTYNLYIATVCNDGSESVTNVYTFTTLCVPEIAPFVENFDAGTTLPMCWEKATGFASDAFAGVNPTPTTSGWIFTNTYVFGAHHPKLNIYVTTCKYWLISPDIDLSNLTDPALVFNLALTDYNNANPIEDATAQQDDKFMVIISTDHGESWSAENATVWSNTAGADHVYNQISYMGEEVVIDLSEYAGETIRIAFYGESTASGGDNDLHIDNVVVGEMPACNAPSQLTVSTVTEATATIHWKENGTATSWVVEYGEAGFEMGSGDIVTVTDTFVTLTGLLDATHYDAYVKAVCDDGSYSNPGMTTFLTSCLAVSLPYSQNFDSYNTSSAAEFVDCWHRFNNYSTTNYYPYVSSTYSVSGGKSLYFYNTSSTYSVAVLPQIDPTVNPINTLQISFSMRTSATTSKMVIGAITNPLDFNTFTPIDTVENTATATFELFEVPLTSLYG